MTRQRRTWLAGGIVAGALILGSAGAALAATTGVGSGMMDSSTHTAVTGGMMGNGSGSMMGSGSRNMMGNGSGGMMGSGSGTMMGNCDPGAMMGGAGQMMGSLYQPSPQAPVRNLALAQRRVEQYLQRLGNKALKVDEVMEFQRNYYAIVKDTSTGHGAFEVLVNKATGAVYLECGPAMMWNTQYGMMDHMMGYQQPSAPITISAAQARQIAQQWLDQHQPGSTTEAPDQFPGYYTVHILKGGKVTGMLSVNGYSGQVWYHTWHGAFVQMKDLGA
jgi:hypothetical protein